MFITLEELKEFLQITNNNDDTLLTNAIKWATDYIKEYTNRNIAAEDYDYRLDGKHQSELLLKDYPVNSFTTYSHNIWTLWNSIWEDYNSDNYFVQDNGILKANFYNPRWIQNLRLVYNAWYTTIPEDIKYVTTRIAGDMYSNKGKINTDIVRESLDGASIQYDPTRAWLNGEVFLILNNYKLQNV